MPIDFDSPEWRVRIMQDKADVLGYQVRLLWMSDPAEAARKPWIQFIELDERPFGKQNSSAERPLFSLDDAEVKLEEWLVYYNETGCKPLI